MALVMHIHSCMNKLIMCLILILSWQTQAASLKKSATKKRIVAIAFAPTAKNEKKLIKKKVVKSKKREIVEVAFGATTVESDLEPIRESKSKSAKKLFVGPPSPPPTLEASFDNRQLASLQSPVAQPKVILSKEAPSLNKLLRQYKKNFATEAQDDIEMSK